MHYYLISFFSLISFFPVFSCQISFEHCFLPELESVVVQNIASENAFTRLSLEEKQLLLKALLYRFTDAALKIAELQIKEEIISHFQQRHIDIAKIVPIINNFQKITELHASIRNSKKKCSSYIKQNSEAVLTALEHVKATGRNITIHQTAVLEEKLDMYNKQLSDVISYGLQQLAAVEQKLEMPKENNFETIPTSIIKFSNMVDIAGQLEDTTQNIHIIAQSHFPLLKSVVQSGLLVVDTYYTLIRKQLELDNLPINLVQFYNELIDTV